MNRQLIKLDDRWKKKSSDYTTNLYYDSTFKDAILYEPTRVIEETSYDGKINKSEKNILYDIVFENCNENDIVSITLGEFMILKCNLEPDGHLPIFKTYKSGFMLMPLFQNLSFSIVSKEDIKMKYKIGQISEKEECINKAIYLNFDVRFTNFINTIIFEACCATIMYGNV